MSDAGDQPLKTDIAFGVVHISIGVNELARLGKHDGDPIAFARECLIELGEVVLDIQEDAPVKRASRRFRRRPPRLRIEDTPLA